MLAAAVLGDDGLAGVDAGRVGFVGRVTAAALLERNRRNHRLSSGKKNASSRGG
jgi:hypothetical protein